MNYDRKNKLGEGQYAYVFLGKFNEQEVAVKRILKRNDPGDDADEAVQTRELREETAMKTLEHENILKLIHVQEDEDFKYLVLELCVGTVQDYIKGKYTGEMPNEPNALNQMASGLAYIHSKRLVHRDIKPANVLISSSAVLKISDFGFTKPITNSGSFSTTSGPKGTRIYYAPEYLLLEKKNAEEREGIRANVSIDIFSLGCLFFCYITKGGHPFAQSGASNEIFETETTSNILSGNKNAFLGLPNNHYAFEMIDGMTQFSPNHRWKLEQVLDLLKRNIQL